MPVYCFISPDGTKTTEKFFPISKAPDHLMFQGERWERNWAAEMHGGTKSSTWPQYSNAMGVSLAEDQSKYRQYGKSKGVDIKFDRRGRMVFDSKGHRKQVCEALGATDKDGGYGDPFSG